LEQGNLRTFFLPHFSVLLELHNIPLNQVGKI
jgi:hypothetical protein